MSKVWEADIQMNRFDWKLAAQNTVPPLLMQNDFKNTTGNPLFTVFDVNHQTLHSVPLTTESWEAILKQLFRRIFRGNFKQFFSPPLFRSQFWVFFSQIFRSNVLKTVFLRGYQAKSWAILAAFGQIPCRSWYSSRFIKAKHFYLLLNSSIESSLFEGHLQK